MSIGKLNVFRRTADSDETYAAPYQCLKCGFVWIGAQHYYDERDKFRFCPGCGIRFEKELVPSDDSERHRDLRYQVKSNHTPFYGPPVEYRVQYRNIFEEEDGEDARIGTNWSCDWSNQGVYYRSYNRDEIRRQAIGEWKSKLREVPWIVDQEVRLVATVRGVDRVIMGPVRLKRDPVEGKKQIASWGEEDD